MRAVFEQALEEAAAERRSAAWRLLARELTGIVPAALEQHLTASGRSSMVRSRWEELRGWRLAALLAPLGLTLLVVVANIARVLIPAEVSYAILGLLAIFALAGIVRGLPTWFLPSVGFLFGVVLLFTFQSWMILLARVIPDSPDYWVRLVVGSGMPFFGLAVLVPLMVLLSAVIPHWRGFYRRVREDWTMLSLALYGLLVLMPVLSFDSYRGEEPFSIAALLVAGAGVIAYLMVARRWRLGVLFAGMSVAMLIIAVARWVLVPTQVWPIAPGTMEVTRQNEVANTIAIWGWLVLLIFGLPALLGRALGRIRGPEPAS
jgi:hypothetical protein